MRFQLVASSLIYVKYFEERINFRNFTVSLHRVIPEGACKHMRLQEGSLPFIIWGSSEPAFPPFFIIWSNLLRRSLRHDDIFDNSRRGEKSGLAKQIASAVRKLSSATTGTPEYVNAISRQLSIAANALRSAFTARGGSGYANREDELRKHKSYEDEIADESHLSY